MDRLLEKPRNSTSGVFRFLGLVLAPLHHDPMPYKDGSTSVQTMSRLDSFFGDDSVMDNIRCS